MRGSTSTTCVSQNIANDKLLPYSHVQVLFFVSIVVLRCRLLNLLLAHPMNLHAIGARERERERERELGHLLYWAKHMQDLSRAERLAVAQHMPHCLR